MAATEENPPNPNIQEEEEGEADDNEEEEEEDDDDDEDEYYEEEEEEEDPADTPSSTRSKLQTLFRRLSTGPVSIRVHDVVIKGNARTKESLIEAEALDALRSASTVQELIRAAGVANERLQLLGIFERVSITLDAGPPELPGTTNVVIEVVEPKNPLTGDFAVYTKPEY